MMTNTILKNISKILIFSPILIYTGARSYLAYDEGFYALQARWILENNNWIIPTWWGKFILDRTIGIQFLIAKSQSLFGSNAFAAHLPSTLGSLFILILTYYLHLEFFGPKKAIVSPLILSTTYIWFDFAHLATQDMIFSFLVTLGVFSLVKTGRKHSGLYEFCFGFWIGLAFILKTFLIIVPLLSLIPYLLSKKKLLLSKWVWIGILIGFIPFIIWTLLINQNLDKNIILYLIDKVNTLSSNNTFTNPFYYYLWNIPINFLPWSVFSIFGLYINFKHKKYNPLVFYFPVISITLLSLFSTKTPYYPLIISPFLALNAFLGIEKTLNSKKLKFLFTQVTAKLIPLIIFSSIFIYYLFFKKSIILDTKVEIFASIALIVFATSWVFINYVELKHILIPLILGPYLFTSLLVQSGLLTDRSKDIRESMERAISIHNLSEKTIYVNSSEITDNLSQSKIIRVSLLTPNLGKGINNINNLNPEELIWSTLSKQEHFDKNSFEIIYTDESINPWKLIKRKK